MSKSIVFCKSLKDRSYWMDRAARQIEFAHYLCGIDSLLDPAPLETSASLITHTCRRFGYLPKEIALEAEQFLQTYQRTAKTFEIDCVGHAHLDMDWMWGYDETVSIILDTFRTMLLLMDEYPEFTFAQSQASTYRIVEIYEPSMIQEITTRIAEGRWEVTASAWTEFDKNMSCSESQIRQYQYASQYISALLHIPKSDLIVGFEPDTFGHHARIPDVLSECGIRYYYHCRGDVNHTIYRWKGYSDNEIIAYREPSWYLGPVVTPFNDPSKGTMRALKTDMGSEVMKIHRATGIRRALQIYGVGNHGGGVTRMDIEGLKDIAAWSCYPKISFSTLKNYFQNLEPYRQNMPIVTGEINSIFPGCYTSQSEIKRGNHESEKMLYEAEFYDSFMSLKGLPVKKSLNLDSSLERVLFNQFHDILPGSCTSVSKSYTLGEYQKVFAAANTGRTWCLRNLADHIDTSSLLTDHKDPGGRALGAGVGYRNDQYESSPIGRTEGPERVITLFNSTSSVQRETARIILWDWEDTTYEITCFDHEGKQLLIVVENEQMIFWQHSATIIHMPVEVPPFGYASYVIKSDTSVSRRNITEDDKQRKQIQEQYVLENQYIRAEFSSQTFDLISLIDKTQEKELLATPSGIRLCYEDSSSGMTAWTVGRENSFAYGILKPQRASISHNGIQSIFQYELTCNDSLIQVSMRLDTGSPLLRWNADIMWKEVGSKSQTPQLSMIYYFKEVCSEYLYDIPFGTIARSPSINHQPALSWVAKEQDTGAIQLIARGKHGFCCTETSMQLLLLRSSSDPDPFPEIGEHHIAFMLTIHNQKPTRKVLLAHAQSAITDLQQVTHGAHTGVLPLNSTCLKVEGPFFVTAVALQDEGKILLRGFETDGSTETIRIFLPVGWHLIHKGEKVVFTCVDGDDQDDYSCFEFIPAPYGIYTFTATKRNKV